MSKKEDDTNTTPSPKKRSGFKNYTAEEDAIILAYTKDYDPDKPTTLLAMLEDALKQIPPGRNVKGLRDRYYRLLGIRKDSVAPSYNKKLAPGPGPRKTKPVVKEPEPVILRIEEVPVAKPVPKIARHPAIREPTSFIKPPTKQQLMSRTGRLIKWD